MDKSKIDRYTTLRAELMQELTELESQIEPLLQRADELEGLIYDPPASESSSHRRVSYRPRRGYRRFGTPRSFYGPTRNEQLGLPSEDDLDDSVEEDEDNRDFDTSDLRVAKKRTASATGVLLDRAEKVAKAQDLKAQKMSISAIAKEMGASESTVRGWLKNDIPKKRASPKKVATQKGTNRTVKVPNAEEEQLLEFLRSTPGASRQQVGTFFEGKLDGHQVSLMLSRMAKRRAIQNRGPNKQRPAWFLVKS